MKTISATFIALALCVAPAWAQTNFTFGTWINNGSIVVDSVAQTWTGSDWTVTSGSIKDSFEAGGSPSGWASPIVGTVSVGLDGTSQGTISTLLDLNGTGFSGGAPEALTFTSLSGTTQAAVVGDVSASETAGIIDIGFYYSVEPGVTPPVYFSVDLGGSPAQTIDDLQGPNQPSSVDWAYTNLYFSIDSSPVPDGGETAPLLGTAVAALLLLRRRSIATT